MQTAEKKVLLRVSNLKQYFPLKKKGQFVRANDGITLDIYEGETFGLVGESGCGKTTTGRTIIRLYDPTGGTVKFDGREISGKMNKDLHKYLSKTTHLQYKMAYYQKAKIQ